MKRDLQKIIDADYEVVGGPYQVGEEHRREKGWYFTGKYNADSDPYFMRHPSWFRRLRFWRELPLKIAGVLLVIIVLSIVLALVGESMSAGRTDSTSRRDAALAELVKRGTPLSPQQMERARELGLISSPAQ